MSRTPARVLMIVENLPVPFDRRVWLEATTLTRHGYAVSVICPKAKGFNRSFETLEDIHIYRYPVPVDAGGALGFCLEFVWCFIATAVLSVWIGLFGRGFDIIHACNPPDTFWLLGRFWRLFGCRFVFDHHDLSPEMYAAKFGRHEGLFYRGLLWLERQSFRASNVVITTNESHKAIAVRRGGRKPEEVFVVRSGPDLKRFRRYPIDESYRAGKTNLLVYLGEICKQDGVDHLVRAVKILRDELGRSDFHCLFIGGGPHQPVIRDYAETVGITNVATFTGRVSDEDLCRMLSSATLGIDPDPKTPWSDKSTMNKVIEYMYFGLPVVAFDLVETRVSAGNAAIYAVDNSDRDLALKIAYLLDHPDERDQMANAGMRRVTEALAWDYSVPILLAAYDMALARKARVPPGKQPTTSRTESPSHIGF